jgi:hypothetical protein
VQAAAAHDAHGWRQTDFFVKIFHRPRGITLARIAAFFPSVDVEPEGFERFDILACSTIV